MDEQEMMRLATATYRSECNANGLIYQEPGEALSRIEGNVVTLANIHGDLARVTMSNTTGSRIMVCELAEAACDANRG